MDYTIAVTIKTPQLKTKMAEFLREAYRPWPEFSFVDQQRIPTFRGPIEGQDKCNIEFVYSDGSPQPEREYHYSLCRWIALKAGRKRRQFRTGEFSKPAPYVTYDNCDVWPVLAYEEWEEMPDPAARFECDWFGVRYDDMQLRRELAWHFVPKGTHEFVAIKHLGQSPEAISEALITSGLEGTEKALRLMRAEISRLDVLWSEDGYQMPAHSARR